MAFDIQIAKDLGLNMARLHQKVSRICMLTLDLKALSSTWRRHSHLEPLL